MSLDGYHPVNGAVLSARTSSNPLSSALPVSMNVAAGESPGVVGFSNEGYWGMDVKKQKYTGSFWVKGTYEGVFTASLQSALDEEIFGSVEIESNALPGKWVEHAFELLPVKNAQNSNNTFAITFDPTVRIVRHFCICDFLTLYRAPQMDLSTSILSACFPLPTRAEETGCVLMLPRHWRVYIPYETKLVNSLGH